MRCRRGSRPCARSSALRWPRRLKTRRSSWWSRAVRGLEQLNPEEMKREELALEFDLHVRDCQDSFEDYCSDPELFANEPPAEHHAFMIGALEGVARGEIKRLMVLMPPGHGKSVYCSIRFPSWYLGKYPKQYLIHATYGGELASLNGRKVRNLIDCEEYAAIFRDVTIADDFKGRADWATSQGGQYYATGVGGG